MQVHTYDSDTDHAHTDRMQDFIVCNSSDTAMRVNANKYTAVNSYQMYCVNCNSHACPSNVIILYNKRFVFVQPL